MSISSLTNDKFLKKSVQKIIHNFLRNPADRQTNRPRNITKAENTTSSSAAVKNNQRPTFLMSMADSISPTFPTATGRDLAFSDRTTAKLFNFAAKLSRFGIWIASFGGDLVLGVATAHVLTWVGASTSFGDDASTISTMVDTTAAWKDKRLENF